MPVPKQRHNKSRKGRRRAGQKSQSNPVKTQNCSHCGASVISHRVCPKCGYYKGRKVVDVVKKAKTKKQK